MKELWQKHNEQTDLEVAMYTSFITWAYLAIWLHYTLHAGDCTHS